METAKERSRETGTHGKSQPQKVHKTTVNSIFIILDWGFSLTERDLYMKERRLCERLLKHRLRILIRIFVWADAATQHVYEIPGFHHVFLRGTIGIAEVNKVTR